MYSRLADSNILIHVIARNTIHMKSNGSHNLLECVEPKLTSALRSLHEVGVDLLDDVNNVKEDMVMHFNLQEPCTQ